MYACVGVKACITLFLIQGMDREKGLNMLNLEIDS